MCDSAQSSSRRTAKPVAPCLSKGSCGSRLRARPVSRLLRQLTGFKRRVIVAIHTRQDGCRLRSDELEAYLSTKPAAPGQNAWVSGPHEDSGWPPDIEAQAPEESPSL